MKQDRILQNTCGLSDLRGSSITCAYIFCVKAAVIYFTWLVTLQSNAGLAQLMLQMFFNIQFHL